MMSEGNLAHYIEEKEHTDDVRVKKTTPFSKMLLSSSVRKGLQDAGFVYPTVIQAIAIPAGKTGSDFLVQSKSGTGKTLIFSVILLEAYHFNVVEPQSLIVVPTREIAVQIENVLNRIGRHCQGFHAVSIIGGMDVAEDRKRLNGAKAVVGTPGRLMHVIQNEVFNTSKIKLLVLDEADQLYTQSFRKDMQRIVKALPRQRQTIACSATFSNDLDKEIAQNMIRPLLISTEEKTVLLMGIKQFVYDLPEEKTSILEMQSKLEALRYIFGQIVFKQCLIFAGSQSRADSYRNYLEKDGWPCDLISGAQEQRTRLEMFQKFREFKTRILIATDLMARGVDSEHVNLVINLELPTDVVTYLHRVGRCGRFGSHGIAISFVSSRKDRIVFKQLIRDVGYGMSVLNFPKNLSAEKKCDLWDFEDFKGERERFGVFNPDAIAPLASQDLSSTLSDVQNDKENKTNNVYNSYSSIDTKTFQVDSKDSALNMNELIADVTQPALTESRQSSSQQLPSSNTIDDASSIAADSTRSSQLDISRYQSVLMEKVAIPTLVEFLVDSHARVDETTKNDKPKKCPLNVFEDYRKSVLRKGLSSSSFDEDLVKSDEHRMSSRKLSTFKSLLIDKPETASNNAKVRNQDHLYSDYANYDENEEDSMSVSAATVSEDITKGTFIPSMATPSNTNVSIKELQNPSAATSDSRSSPEKQHFPSPVHIELNKNDRNVNALRDKCKTEKLTINVGAQIEIPPIPSIAALQDFAAIGEVVDVSPNGSDLEPDHERLDDSGSSTERGGGSSGFNEKTSSASSGIETSEHEHEHEYKYETSDSSTSGEISEDESCDYEKDADEDEDVTESDEESRTELNDEIDQTKDEEQLSTSSTKENKTNGSSHNSLYDQTSSEYLAAYARWTQIYQEQVTTLQKYMKLVHRMQPKRYNH